MKHRDGNGELSSRARAGIRHPLHLPQHPTHQKQRRLKGGENPELDVMDLRIVRPQAARGDIGHVTEIAHGLADLFDRRRGKPTFLMAVGQHG